MSKIDALEQQINARLVGKVTGYAYAIYQHEALQRAGGGGYAVLSPATPMTADTRVTMLSMSKTITAAALMKAIELLQAEGSHVSISSPIAPHLPSDWVRGPGVEHITFCDLLRHDSRLDAVEQGPDPDPDVYANLRQTIANGQVLPPQPKPGKNYRNCNFALLRILIPYLTRDPVLFKLPEIYGLADSLTGHIYVEFVKHMILDPLGIQVDAVPTGPLPYTQYYNFATGAFLPPQASDAYRRTGAGYWYMSVKEYGKFIAKLRHGKVITSDSWKIMDENWLGLYHTAGANGDYIDHNGGYTIKGAGAAGDWAGFPDGITAVIYYNSQGGLTHAPQQILMEDAYDSSQGNWRWCNKCQCLSFAGTPVLGPCIAGGDHDHTGSGNYLLFGNTPFIEGQPNWRWCNKCQCLAFAGAPSVGPCHAGGQHNHQGSGDYVLQDKTPVIPGQSNWRWCNKCQCLSFAGTPSLGPCPAGGVHAHQGSGNYTLSKY